MARVNIYLPDDLATQAKEAGLNVSQVAQEALRDELGRRRTADWVARVRAHPPTGVSHEQAIEALHAIRDETGTRRA